MIPQFIAVALSLKVPRLPNDDYTPRLIFVVVVRCDVPATLQSITHLMCAPLTDTEPVAHFFGRGKPTAKGKRAVLDLSHY
jgi:hypothetical protein